MGSMGWNGVGVLTEVQGIKYCEILDSGVVPRFEKLDMEEGEWYFQQDNDPKHRAKRTDKRTDKWFQNNSIKVLDWPAQFPDLIPIKHLWHHIKKQLEKYLEAPKGVHELWEG
jgi:hypothetical protein